MRSNINLVTDLPKLFGIAANHEEFGSKHKAFKIIWDKLRPIGQYNSFYLAKLLWVMPFTEGQWKIYDKLDKNARFGFLSKHLIRCAKKNGVPSLFIKEYIESKGNWKFAKEYVDVFAVQEGSKNDERSDELYKKTVSLIEVTIEMVNRNEVKLV